TAGEGHCCTRGAQLCLLIGDGEAEESALPLPYRLCLSQLAIVKNRRQLKQRTTHASESTTTQAKESTEIDGLKQRNQRPQANIKGMWLPDYGAWAYEL
ncbi:hypothetical protein Dimus_000862, partial [Dionaea muscipula]